MVSQAEVQGRIREFVVREMLFGDDRGLTDTSPLLEWGVLNSLRLVELVSYIQETFGVEIPEDALSGENFASIGAIGAMVSRLAGGAR